MASTSVLKAMVERYRQELVKRKPEAIKGNKAPKKPKVPKLDMSGPKRGERLN